MGMISAVRTSRVGKGTVLAAAVLLVGCQTFQPVTTGEVGRGDRVRLQLSEPSSLELRQVTAHDVTTVAGEAVEVRDGDLILSAFWLERPTGVGFPGEGWTVDVPLSSVERLEERRLAVWRTAGAVAAVVLGTAFGWETLRGGEGGGGGNGGGNTTK